MSLLPEERILVGYPICRGISIGKPFFLHREPSPIFEINLPQALTPREIERYRYALSRSKQDIKRLQKQLEAESVTGGTLILEGQLEMLQDPLLTIEIEMEIHKSKKNAEFVLRQSILKLEARFRALNDLFFAERFKDLQDLAHRIFSYLHESAQPSLNDVPPNSIVCAHELSASDIASAQVSCVDGFLTETGASTTHAAIVAKAKGIPYITHVDLQSVKDSLNHLIIIDGRSGKVIINPSERTIENYRALKERLNRQMQALGQMTHWPAQTFDGFSIRLNANVDMVQEIDHIHELGGDGIGLFRSEYIFLPKNEIPSEDEQFAIYSNMIQSMKNLPVVIRTFDLGGDKIPLNHGYPAERNSFLGIRSTRFLLKERDLFKAQLKAILRASVNGHVSILLPMIATLSELHEAKDMIAIARKEVNLFHPVRLGCMIEVPSAAMIIDHFAKECDFFSIGTNDLIQYALAIDRGDQSLSEFHEPTDPSLIRLISLIVNEANKARIPVSVCGEMASDPRFTALLLGLGIQELSVAPPYLPVIKNVIRKTSIVDAIHLSEKVLELKTSREILFLLTDYYRQTVPDDLFYNHI